MIGALLVLGSVLAAQTPDDSALSAEVRKLVRHLDADELATRDAAEAKLLDLGPRVLPLLPDVTDKASAELKLRLGRIRQKLQHLEAQKAAEPSRVTLAGESLPLAKILATIQEQTGNRIIDARPQFGGAPPGPALTIKFDKTPFWQALDTITDQAALGLYPFGQPEAIQIVARPENQLPRLGRAAYSGPFRVEPLRVLARRELRTSAEPVLLLTQEVAWEPRLRPIGLKQRMADIEAKDDRGERIAPEDPQAEIEAFPRRDATAVEMGLPLARPAGAAKTIASLKGRLRAIVPGKIETFTFTDLLKAKNAQKRIADATVTVEEVRKNEGDLWELRIRLRFDDAGDALESHRTWVLLNEAYLEKPGGERIAYDSSETTQRSKNEIGMGYIFALDKPPADLTFVYKTPGMIITAEFPYELSGIKLP